MFGEEGEENRDDFVGGNVIEVVEWVYLFGVFDLGIVIFNGNFFFVYCVLEFNC